MKMKNLIACAMISAWTLAVAGCGGSSSGGDASSTPAPVSPPAPTTSHTVGGATFGLLGTLVLQNNGGDALTLTADGTFKFSTALATGAAYAVAVRTQPANQICTVGNGNGVIAAVDVANVTVNCSTITQTVHGTAYGLAPSESVVLRNNGGDDLTINANGSFAFATPVAQSGTYNVTVLTQPATQTCTVSNGNGTVTPSGTIDVQVTCSTNAYTVGGTISGLSGTVVLQNNGADNLSQTTNGSFAFSTPVAQGATYNVTVLTQPATQTCTVTNGSGTMNGSAIANVGVNCVANATTLSMSVADLALSVTGLTEYGVAGTPSSGLARVITVTNTGSYDALNLAIATPVWPSGTTSSTTCGSVLTASASCTITVTPGSTATSDGTNPCSSGTAPIPGAIDATADNANTVSANAVVLSYACIYQGGYVYGFDDTTPNTQSVSGHVLTTVDQAAPPPSGVIWSSNGNSGIGGDAVFDNIYGISETSTASSPSPNVGQVAGQVACNGALDGACNTNNIYVYYQNFAVGSPINTSYYAAGLCTQTISGYTDWSLPAMCEMGYGNGVCGIQSSPTLQNVQSNLVEFNGINLLSGHYWTSTSYSFSPQLEAWIQDLHPGGSPGAFPNIKASQVGSRCSRAF